MKKITHEQARNIVDNCELDLEESIIITEYFTQQENGESLQEKTRELWGCIVKITSEEAIELTYNTDRKSQILLQDYIKQQDELLGLYRELSNTLELTIIHDTEDTWEGCKDYDYLEIEGSVEDCLEIFKQIKSKESELKGSESE